MDVARAPYTYPSAPLNTTRHYQLDHDEVRDAGSLHRHTREVRQASTTSSIEIHDGFDFGFDKPLASPPDNDEDLDNAWSPPTGRFSGKRDTFGSEVRATEFGYAIMPRPAPAGFDEAGFFMKKGQWKRRGIVFYPDIPMASEDETFDLP
jgi:hypothetical protein